MFTLFKTAAILVLIVTLICAVGLFSIYLSIPDVAELKNENPKITAFMDYRIQEASNAGKRLGIHKRWIGYRDIPDPLIKATIVAEDASFWIHHGIDWFEIKESIQKNWEEGEFARGGSTITQQLAKNLYLSPKKTFYRKIKEWFIARELEEELKKSRILELYLNTIEFGRGVFGIRAASRAYFHKEPGQLELWEMIRLIAIIPNPLHLKPTYPSTGLKWRSKVILYRLYKYNFITEEEYLRTKEQLSGFFESYH
jgi:monofunctional biosynthetic peptidoglycan transglycosylase